MKMPLETILRRGLPILAAAVLGACGTATEWINEDPDAGRAEAAPSRSARDIVASLGSAETRTPAPETAPPVEAAPSPEPQAAPAPQVAEQPEKKRRTVAEMWADWQNSKKTEETPAAPEPQVAEVPSEPEPVAAAAPEPEKKRKTVAEKWNEWFGGGKEEPAAPVAASNEAAPQPQAARSGSDVDVSQLDLRGNFPTARKVKDWEGYVHSPYDDAFINVKGISSGSLVADPRFPLEERKYFRVP